MDERIGHYRVVSELGRGGMGVVYKAHEESLNRFVAIKVLGEHLASDPSYVQRFLREAQSAASLNHPNIVQIHMVGDHEGRHYFAMEFVTGTNLQQLLTERGRLPQEDAARLVIQAAAGLAAAHDQGVIHRDIKPANLLIDERGLVKIADFGLAFLRSSVSRLTATGIFMGTPGYLAPEQCREEEVDQRTDIYALGVTFYEALAGRMPFNTTNPLALLRQIMEVEPPDVAELNPEVDGNIRQVLHRMMAKDREKRPATCHELIAELQGHLDRLTAAGVGVSGVAPVVAKPLTSAAVTPPGNSSDQVAGVAPTIVVGGPQPAADPPTMVTTGTGAVGSDQATVVTAPQAPTQPAPSAPQTPVPVAQTQAVVSGEPRAGGFPFKLAAVVGLVVVAAIIGGVLAMRLFGGGEPPATVVVVNPTPIEETAEPKPTVTSGSVTVVEPTPAPVVKAPNPTARPKVVTSAPATVVVVEPTPGITEAVKEAPTATAVPPTPTPGAVDLLIQDLSSSDSTTLQRAAKVLYRRHRAEPKVHEAAAKALLAKYDQKSDDGRHVDAMAWLCNILGASGNKAYAATLETVLETTESRKIKGFAKKNLGPLQ